MQDNEHRTMCTIIHKQYWVSIDLFMYTFRVFIVMGLMEFDLNVMVVVAVSIYVNKQIMNKYFVNSLLNRLFPLLI